jgi:hypothetical protein
MKKKILGKLTLGKRSIASLSNDSMGQLQGGGPPNATRIGCNDPDTYRQCPTAICPTNACTAGCNSAVCSNPCPTNTGCDTVVPCV